MKHSLDQLKTFWSFCLHRLKSNAGLAALKIDRSQCCFWHRPSGANPWVFHVDTQPTKCFWWTQWLQAGHGVHHPLQQWSLQRSMAPTPRSALAFFLPFRDVLRCAANRNLELAATPHLVRPLNSAENSLSGEKPPWNYAVLRLEWLSSEYSSKSSKSFKLGVQLLISKISWWVFKNNGYLWIMFDEFGRHQSHRSSSYSVQVAADALPGKPSPGSVLVAGCCVVNHEVLSLYEWPNNYQKENTNYSNFKVK